MYNEVKKVIENDFKKFYGWKSFIVLVIKRDG